MPIEKNITKVKASSLVIPDPLQQRKEFYEEAGYRYTFDEREQNYIKYNTLRNKRKDKELIDVIKIYRLQDRESGQEHLVYYQQSKVFDFNNNLVPCPIAECYGVVHMPKTNIIKNENDEVTDIALVETQNFYPEEFEFSKEKVIELFNKSRSSQNISCYVGFTKNPKTGVNDFIENKKLIRDQDAFINKDFDDLITLSDNANMKKTWKNNKENTLKKLRHNKMKNVSQEGIEKRVKDNGQIWLEDPEEVSKRDLEEAKKNGTLQDAAQEQEDAANEGKEEENNKEESGKAKQEANKNQQENTNNKPQLQEQQKLRVSRE